MNERKAFSKYPELDYFMNKELCDIEFDIDGQRLPANKDFLSIRNEVFRAMFSDNFKESKERVVPIKGTTFEAFKTLIRFLYCDQLVLKDTNDLTHISQVCQLSDEYAALRLMDKIGEHLTKMSITLENVEPIARLAFNYEFDYLMAKVLEFIDDNFEHIINKDKDYFFALNDATKGKLILLVVNKYRNRFFRLNSYDEVVALITEFTEFIKRMFRIVMFFENVIHGLT